LVGSAFKLGGNVTGANNKGYM